MKAYLSVYSGQQKALENLVLVVLPVLFCSTKKYEAKGILIFYAEDLLLEPVFSVCCSGQHSIFHCQIELAVVQITEGSKAIFPLKGRHLKIYE